MGNRIRNSDTFPTTFITTEFYTQFTIHLKMSNASSTTISKSDADTTTAVPQVQTPITECDTPSAAAQMEELCQPPTSAVTQGFFRQLRMKLGMAKLRKFPRIKFRFKREAKVAEYRETSQITLLTGLLASDKERIVEYRKVLEDLQLNPLGLSEYKLQIALMDARRDVKERQELLDYHENKLAVTIAQEQEKARVYRKQTLKLRFFYKAGHKAKVLKRRAMYKLSPKRVFSKLGRVLKS